MNTNMTGFRCFSEIFASFSFGRMYPQHWKVVNLFMPGQIYLSCVVCSFKTFVNNLEIKHKFTNNLKESCEYNPDQHILFKYFLENALCTKMIPNSKVSIWLLW